jgi:hypothetical protein
VIKTEKTAVPCAARAFVNTPLNVALPPPDHAVEPGVENFPFLIADGFATVVTPVL